MGDSKDAVTSGGADGRARYGGQISVLRSSMWALWRILWIVWLLAADSVRPTLPWAVFLILGVCVPVGYFAVPIALGLSSGKHGGGFLGVTVEAATGVLVAGVALGLATGSLVQVVGGCLSAGTWGVLDVHPGVFNAGGFKVFHEIHVVTSPTLIAALLAGLARSRSHRLG